MALVKILASNIFAGAGFQKLEVGTVYDIEDTLAEKFIAEGKAEKSSERKGVKLEFEVATLSKSDSGNELELEEASRRIIELEEKTNSLATDLDSAVKASGELNNQIASKDEEIAALKAELEEAKAKKAK
ncbi:hypothetical protein [Providencia stuartii]|uniref:hypothetical protein n=1 Tax=Providencia stuartii TaxID=588 RepID=UPI00111CD4C5|nr:hypothetical protein [Providencia stuartii]